VSFGKWVFLQAGEVVLFEVGKCADDSFADAMLTNICVTPDDGSVENRSALVTSGLQVAPNPARDVAVVQLSHTATGTTDLHLTDQLGKVVWSFQGIDNQDQVSIDVSALPNGIYFITTVTNQKKTTKRLVVSK
jgi:hypothetical protein